jgi:Uma2 family endonuclease
MRLGAALVAFVYPRQLGRVYAAETGFKLDVNPDTVRAPDVAFIRRERLGELPPHGYPAFAPDLAVEVLSPDDRLAEVSEKIEDASASGVAGWWSTKCRRTARV